MNRTSQLFLFLLLAISALALYNSTIPASGAVAGTRFLALSGFFLIAVTLLLGPLAVIWPQKFAALIEPRRAIGISSFFLVLFHALLSFAEQFGWDFTIFLANLPAQLGLAALAIFLPLALTSADWATKLLGQNAWKNLQRLNYLAFAISLWHFVLKANGLSLPSPNLAEVFLMIFAIAAIGFQVAGFLVVGKRKREAARRESEGKEKAHAPVSQNSSAIAK